MSDSRNLFLNLVPSWFKKTHDNPPTPVKFRVFTQYLPMRVEAAGVYTIGLYNNLDETETDVLFPLPVLKRNPLLQTRIP